MTSARGLQTANWYKLMAKLINDAGGWKIGNDTYTVDMIIYNTQGNMVTAKDLLTRLVLQDGCKFIINTSFLTSSADVDATVTEPNKVIAITLDLTNQAVNPKYQYYYPTGNFFQNADVYKIYTNMVKKGVKSYVSVKMDNQMGRSMDPAMNLAWKLASPTIDYKGTVWEPMSTVDWGPIATKIKSMNPDCVDLIYTASIPNSIPSTYRALADIGYKGYITPGQMSQPILDALVVNVGKAAVEGGEVPGADPNTWQQEPQMRSLIDAYSKEYGKWSTDAGPVEFQVLQAAINGAQSVDTDVVKAYLDNSQLLIPTLSGFFEYFARPDVGNNRPISGANSGKIAVIKDGKLVDSGTFTTIKDQYLFTIKSRDMVDVYKAYWEKYGYPTFPAAQKGMESFHYSDLGITGQD
jgi:ABC-type branched-subunit amino acid transport system substrate-binding protein